MDKGMSKRSFGINAIWVWDGGFTGKTMSQRLPMGPAAIGLRRGVGESRGMKTGQGPQRLNLFMEERRLALQQNVRTHFAKLSLNPVLHS